MMKLHEYKNNRMNKQQMNEYLKDDSILVCCEFDYISYELLSQDDNGYKEAYEAWSEYKDAIKSFGVVYEQSLRDKFDIETFINIRKAFIKEYQFDIQTLRTSEDIVPTTKSRKINELKDYISKNRTIINDLYVKYEEKEKEYQNLQVPYIDINAYIKYMGETNIKEFDPIIWILEGFIDDEFIQEPNKNEDLDVIDFKGLEFIDECTVDIIETLGKGGVKITLPSYPITKAIKYIEQLCEWIENGNGETNDACMFRLLMMREDDKINRDFYLTESNYSKKVDILLDILRKETYKL